MNDTVTVTSPTGVIMRMKVVGISHTGVLAFDEVNAYVLLKKNQILQGKTNIVNQIRMRADDINQSRALATKIESRFGYKHRELGRGERGRVRRVLHPEHDHVFGDGRDPHRRLLRHLQHHLDGDLREDARHRDHEIDGLRRGRCAQRSSCSRAWRWAPSARSSAARSASRLTYLLSVIRFKAVGLVEIQQFILKWSVWHYAIASGIAMVSAVAAAYIPSRRAAKVNPVEIVRGAQIKKVNRGGEAGRSENARQGRAKDLPPRLPASL